ncbi:MAG TPA: bifunctional riboflavin kinase/FAD synthetase [Desulfuromonadales bacterium]|nr:bifunctional riboflavin kinase/FAD synthetase [Desulfuromonadales bacterium]
MRLILGSQAFDKNFTASVLTVGNFDGIHRGHLEVFRQLKRKADEKGLPAVIVTFDPHPLKVLAPRAVPPQLTTLDQKVELITAAAMDSLVVIPFTTEFSRITAENFVRELLCNSLGMRHIVIGHDYAFGRGREGNFSTLERLGDECGFTVDDVPPIGEEGAVFSSSLVRGMIAAGDMPAAAGILGRYYSIAGTVEHGCNRGHSLGFPTANIDTPNELLPPDGVYAVMANIDGTLVKGACNIGCNPTFESSRRTVEAFLLDFTGDIYEHSLRLHFVQKLRPVHRFPDAASLKDAICKDVVICRQLLDAINLDRLKPGVRQEQRAL